MAPNEAVSCGKAISPPPTKRQKLLDSADLPSRHAIDRLTIYSWNVNGVTPLLPTQRPITSFFKASASDPAVDSSVAAPAKLRDVLRRYVWPTMLFLQEVKVSPDDHGTRRAVEKAVLPDDEESPRGPCYRAFFCLPTDKHNARGFGRKVYGVCSIIRQDFYDAFVDKVRPVKWDNEGRFLVCETRATSSLPKLAIFNIYAVNGTDLPYKNETGQIDGTRHDRKLRVHSLLQAECRALESEGKRVILAGDMNIARTPQDGHPSLRTLPKQHCLNRADFERRFFHVSGSQMAATRLLEDEKETGHGLDMIDTFRDLHKTRAGYTYYPRGKPFGSSCDRVDMILASRTLLEQLAAAGMHATPLDRGSSDHVPLYATFNFEREAR